MAKIVNAQYIQWFLTLYSRPKLKESLASLMENRKIGVADLARMLHDWTLARSKRGKPTNEIGLARRLNQNGPPLNWDEITAVCVSCGYLPTLQLVPLSALKSPEPYADHSDEAPETQESNVTAG